MFGPEHHHDYDGHNDYSADIDREMMMMMFMMLLMVEMMMMMMRDSC